MFVSRTLYTKIHAMPTDMPVIPVDTLPKQFYVCGKMHVAFIARGISHAHVKILKNKHFVVYVALEMFHQMPVWEFSVKFQDNKGNLCRRTENIPASKPLLTQTYGFCHTFKRKQRVKLVQFTLIKLLRYFSRTFNSV